jgi:hypothetical protein
MMRTNRWISFIMMACLALGLVALGNAVSSGQAPKAKAGAGWEYKTAFLRAAGDPQESLNTLGNDLGPQGWELVAFTEYGPRDAQNKELLCVFKRAKP